MDREEFVFLCLYLDIVRHIQHDCKGVQKDSRRPVTQIFATSPLLEISRKIGHPYEHCLVNTVTCYFVLIGKSGAFFLIPYFIFTLNIHFHCSCP